MTKALIIAIQLLTRLPVPVQIEYQKRTVLQSTVYFPLAGLVVGAAACFAAWLSLLFLPFPAAAVLTLMIWTAASGGLHLDGWMDTADGVLSHRSRERMLDIMKDSRVGAMGVIAAFFILMVKWSMLWSLFNIHTSLFVLLLIPIWSRWTMVWAIRCWPYVRGEGGMGHYLRDVKTFHALAATGVAILLTALIGFASKTIYTEWSLFLLFPLCSIFSGSLFAFYLMRKLGGLTGDTYGAINELVETVLLITVWIWLT